MSTHKTSREARIERITWVVLVLIFVIVSRDEGRLIPIEIVPYLCAAVLFFSGIYQISQGYGTSFILFMVVTALVGVGLWGSLGNPFIDPTLISLLLVIGVIGIGVITNEN